MSAKHTAGPWTNDDGDITGVENDPANGCVGLVDVAHVYLRTVPGRSEANARLISAAPDLIAYAECEEAMHQSLTDPSAREKLNKHGFDGRDVFGFLRRMRQSAIAKARGQS